MAEHECQAIGTKSTAVTSGPLPLSATGFRTGDSTTAAPPSAISRLTPGRCRCGNGAILAGAGWSPAAGAQAQCGRGRRGAQRRGGGAGAGVRGGVRGSAGKMDEFQAAEEVTAWGTHRAQLPPWRLLSGPAEGLRRCPSAPDPTPRRPPRHPCRPPPGWSRVSRHRRRTGPAFVLPPPGVGPSPGVHWALLHSGFYPCCCRSFGKRREGCGGLGLAPQEQPSAVVGGRPVLFGPGQNSSRLFLCGKRSPSLSSASCRRTSGAHTPFTRYGVG